MNQDLKLLALYDKIGKRISELEEHVNTVKKLEGPMGPEGRMGEKGEKGDRGRDGADGAAGADGVDGTNGQDGKDGVSVVGIELDFDNHLRCTLSNGTVLDAGPIDLGDVLKEQAAQVVNYYGSGIGKAEGAADVFIQDTQPQVDGPYLWIQTNYGSSGCSTFWIEDGK